MHSGKKKKKKKGGSKIAKKERGEIDKGLGN